MTERPRTNDELLCVRARLRAELEGIESEIRERRIAEYRPMCPIKGHGPDGVERWCANQIRHPGRCEFIYFLGTKPYAP